MKREKRPTCQSPLPYSAVETRRHNPRLHARLPVVADGAPGPEPDCSDVVPVRVDLAEQLWGIQLGNIECTQNIPRRGEQVGLAEVRQRKREERAHCNGVQERFRCGPCCLGLCQDLSSVVRRRWVKMECG